MAYRLLDTPPRPFAFRIMPFSSVFILFVLIVGFAYLKGVQCHKTEGHNSKIKAGIFKGKT